MNTLADPNELPLPPRTSLGPPRLTTSSGVLFQADCLDLLENLPDDSIHVVFADPPFNLGKDYGNGFLDNLADHSYLEWSYRWIEGCCRVLAPGGAFFIYVLPRLAAYFATRMEGHCKLVFRHWIALTMKATFPRGTRLYPAHYALLYFTKGEPRAFHKLRTPIKKCRKCGAEQKDYGGYRSLIHSDGVTLSDFWDDTSPNRHRSSKARPGINELKPLIPARAIEIASNRGDIVLDPFGGGGSTFQEAQRLGRFWIGSEIGDCKAIEERLRNFDAAAVGDPPPSTVLSLLSRG
jgi:site-specific DNA-methyltransferase (adenine-specific)